MGFPSPAEDFMQDKIDLNRRLILRPAATFFMKAGGDGLCDEGIFANDLLIIDRSLNPSMS